jgi:hypothetical protein
MMEYGAWGWTRATMIEESDEGTATLTSVSSRVAVACQAQLAALGTSFEGWLSDGDTSEDPAAAWDS